MKLSCGDQIEMYAETETEENVPEEKGEKSERKRDKSQSVYLIMINLIFFNKIKE